MKKFISVGIILFPTQGDQKMWLEKWNTFYSPKAIEFLKKWPNRSKILFEKNTDLIRTILIWEYESEEALKNAKHFILIGQSLKIILHLNINLSGLRKFPLGYDFTRY